jgi:hypothetical protein
MSAIADNADCGSKAWHIAGIQGDRAGEVALPSLIEYSPIE